MAHPSQPGPPPVMHRILDGVGYFTGSSIKLATSAVIVVAVATILWTGAVHMGWMPLYLPHIGATLPYIGPITIELTELAATFAVIVLSTLYINSKR